VATRDVFSEEELTRLRGFPAEINRMELIRYFTGSPKIGRIWLSSLVLAAGDGPVRLDDAGALVISPLTAEDVPGEAVALKAEPTDMLSFAPIVSLLIELDGRIGLLACFTHAGGKQARTRELKRNLIAVLISHATNLGLTRMADACGISYDILACDLGVVCPGGDAARGEPGDHRPPPADAAGRGVRHRHPVLV